MSEEELIEKSTSPVGLVDIMYDSDPCNSNLILNSLKSIRLWTDKKKFIDDSMNKCFTIKNKKTRKQNKNTKTKRKMSGYNCYMKECAKKTGNFSGCLTDKGWGKLSEKEKQEYNNMALEGCT